MSASTTIDEAAVWAVLETVPDPEIPVISVVDLGVVREVDVNSEGVKVVITPTYSGCPAMSVISMDIETALAKSNIGRVKLQTRISPPWTTDWLSEKGRARLEEFGIAPPRAAGARPTAGPASAGRGRSDRSARAQPPPAPAARLPAAPDRSAAARYSRLPSDLRSG